MVLNIESDSDLVDVCTMMLAAKRYAVSIRAMTLDLTGPVLEASYIVLTRFAAPLCLLGLAESQSS